nr:AMP-binding protein [Mastigocoleus sp. MO_167.B18]
MSETSTSSPVAKISKEERTYFKRLVDYSHVDALPEIWSLAVKKFGDNVALHAPHIDSGVTFTYAELFENIQSFASGLQGLGVKAGDCISLIADNSPRWLIADQGIMTAGAVNAVRSCQADREELLYILGNSDSTGLIVEDVKTFEKLYEGLTDLPIDKVILLSD